MNGRRFKISVVIGNTYEKPEMSRGLGRIERHVLATLTRHDYTRMPVKDIAAAWAKRRRVPNDRTVRSSLNRAIRKLEAAELVIRDDSKVSLEQYDRKETAYHEAGHAVIARVFKFPVRYATIKPTAKTAGHVVFMKKGYPNHDDIVRRSIVVSAAGQAAENYLAESMHRANIQRYGEKHAKRVRNFSYSTGLSGARADRKQIREMSFFGDTEPWALPVAERLVRKHWKKIERVANALIDKETLSVKEIDRLIRR